MVELCRIICMNSLLNLSHVVKKHKAVESLKKRQTQNESFVRLKVDIKSMESNVKLLLEAEQMNSCKMHVHRISRQNYKLV